MLHMVFSYLDYINLFFFSLAIDRMVVSFSLINIRIHIVLSLGLLIFFRFIIFRMMFCAFNIVVHIIQDLLLFLLLQKF